MTSPDDKTRNLDLLQREAHRWVAQLVSGEATVADAEALKRWVAQSSHHADAFAAATGRWNDFGPAGRALLADEKAAPRTPPRGQINRRLVLGGAGALAAAAVGYAGVRPPLGLWPSVTELVADYRTTTGEQRLVMLTDHIAVQMNTQTSIALPSAADGSNQIKLVAGEASFATSPDTLKSLVVLAGDGRTVASQARFDVRNLGLAVCVSCFDGEIRVEQGTQTATIGARQQIRYDGTGLGPSVAIDPAEASAWQNGVLIFRFTPLSDVVAEINRYRSGKVILLNAALASRPINGRVRISRIDEALLWIEQAAGARSRSLPGGVILLS
jgi:transmembrane sensor